ncbi:hypothetical protein MBLNU457_5104t1 [Dothideomycetes sp. NU457]
MPQDSFAQSQWAHDEYDLSRQPQMSPTFYTNSNTTQQQSLGSDDGRRHSASGNADQESDEKYWIHRDKLAQIESREMAEAGIDVKRPTRSKSKASRSRSASRASTKRAPRHHVEDELPPPVFNDYDGLRNPIVDDYDHPTTGAMDEELQSDEAVEDRGRYQNTRPTGRPSTSRIPVSRNSPAPVSTSYIERESPMSRSRNNSGAWHSNSSPEDGVAGQKFRPRSGSMTNHLREGSSIPRPRTPGSRPTSMHLATNVDELNSSPPPTNSVLAKNPNNNLTSRKGSGRQAPSSSTPKQRTTSTNRDSPLDPNRPRTSGGRVRSINRPEGEAPWIATMYKPDPMLPPDQQILPTHAKRMVSEQKPKEEDIAPSDAPQPIEIEQPIDLPASYKASPQEHFPGAWQPRPTLETIASSATNINKARRESVITGPTRRESIVMGPTAGTARRESVVMGPTTGGRRESVANSVAGSAASRSNSTYRIVPTIQKTPSLRGGVGPGFAGRNASVAGSVAGGQQSAQTQAQARSKADQSLWPPSTPDIHRGEKARKKEKGCGCCVVM